MYSTAATSSVIHADQAIRRRAYPANVTFHDLIRSNKRKSAVLMVGMIVLLIVVGAAFAAGLVLYSGGGDLPSLVPSAILGAGAAGIVGLIAALWSFYGGSNAILRMSGAVEIPREADPQLHNVVEELAIAAGIPKPRIFLINDTALNAFATGRDPRHAAVAITAGLRQQLTRDELAGVMAHELSHIRHFDIRFAMLMATMVGLIVFASDAFRRILFYGGRGGRSGRSSSNGKGGNPVMIVLLIAMIILAIIAPILAYVIRFAVSRQREYLADAGAVELTRYPQGLMSALEKLGACREPLEAANRATAHMYIVNPLKSAMHGEGHELSSVFLTHPPLHDRIKRLAALIQ
ncbi:MAG: M48 family metallopeptidase [Phycisphaerales bacterium]|nr:M48 family metallopeptidase [Phycisphaerales bacterium]MCI0676062.1 M48 family metallopeptidase [Phycisphaerales bacterium]